MIRDELQAEFKDAMKTKDARRRDVIRQVNSELALRRAEPGFAEVDDEELHRDVIAAYVKKMEKARKEYEGFGERGAPMAEQLAFEVEYLSRWLPSRLDEEATRALVAATVAELDAGGDPKAAGRVIGTLMRDHGDELDGGLVNRLVREALDAG